MLARCLLTYRVTINFSDTSQPPCRKHVLHVINYNGKQIISINSSKLYTVSIGIDCDGKVLCTAPSYYLWRPAFYRSRQLVVRTDYILRLFKTEAANVLVT